MNKFLFTALPLAWAMFANAQGKMFTAKDYEQAESMTASYTEPFIDNANVRANWLADDNFWYRILNANGSEFIMVNAAKGTRTPAFDHQKLATALSKATGKSYQANHLPFQFFVLSPDKKSIKLQADGKTWNCDLQTYECTQDAFAMAAPRGAIGRRGFRGNDVTSPDGSKAVFIKDYNLWMRDVATGNTTQLTTDGIKDFGYATDNAGWKQSERPILAWSPDSKKIATFKQDQRNVSDMYLVSTNVGKPTLKAWKYALPGDKEIATIQRVVIDVDVPKVIVFQIPPDPHRATLSDDIASSGTFDDVDWDTDGSKVAFVSTSRDHKQEKFRIADATTGAVREVFEENVPTQYESGWDAINWRYLPKSNEIIWFSERDNWGHLYLYDATTGQVKNQITKGEWVVTQLLKVDEKNRMLYFIADGRQLSNPYFSQLCKIGFDGKHFAVLTPEEGNHSVTFSPSFNYFVDSYSKPDVPAVTVLRNMDGKLINNYFRKSRCVKIGCYRLETTRSNYSKSA
jgi:Tol biopolymer transport system component